MNKLAAVAIAAIAAAAGTARAEEPTLANAFNLIHEIKGGGMVHDTPGWARVAPERKALDINGGIVWNLDVAEAFGGTVRPYTSGTLNFNGETSKAAAGLVWQREFSNGMFLDIGLGAAVHNGPLVGPKGDKKFGSPVLFHIPVEVGVRVNDKVKIGVYYEHMSNANLSVRNSGQDGVGVRLTYKW